MNTPSTGKERTRPLPASFHMTFEPSSHLISVVRRFVKAMCEEILGSGELSSQLALATHEMLENAVKYCVDQQTSVALAVRDAPDGRVITVRTRNNAAREDIERARAIIGDIQHADDRFQFYQQMILEAADRTVGSGLGLARIGAETEMSLDLVIEEGAIEVVATMHTTEGGAQ